MGKYYFNNLEMYSVLSCDFILLYKVRYSLIDVKEIDIIDIIDVISKKQI